MKRTIIRLIISVAAISLIANCGDSDTDDKDGGTPAQTDQSVQNDLDPNNPPQDLGNTPPKDQGIIPHQDVGGAQQPTKAVSNSGQVCSQTVPCPDPANEVCLPLKQGAANGMCLGKCWPDLTNLQNTINICPMADPTSMNSSCGIEVRDPNTNQVVTYACGFICEAVQGQNTLTFNCPNATDFNCEVLDPNQPTIKVCIPKE